VCAWHQNKKSPDLLGFVVVEHEKQGRILICKQLSHGERAHLEEYMLAFLDTQPEFIREFEEAVV
jgi:hypothetical protein